MGYTSSKVKDRWNKLHYDSVNMKMPIGCRNEIQAAAKRHGMSMVQFVRWAILQAVSPEERQQMPILSGQPADDVKNGYVSPFSPPRSTQKMIDRFFEGVRA